jgi:hypothetical protein
LLPACPEYAHAVPDFSEPQAFSVEKLAVEGDHAQIRTKNQRKDRAPDTIFTPMSDPEQAILLAGPPDGFREVINCACA